MSANSTLSVVVIGRNEGENLRHCIESVNAMQRGAWDVELIYVDSGSSDGSVALAESMGVRTIALKPARPTAAMGRNAGWRAARGEWVLFLDGDTLLAEDFVVKSMAAFSDASVAVVWGHRREMHPERSIYNRALDLDWIYAPGYAAFCGGDALFRRNILEQADGFDETLIAGEEPELCRRILAAGSLVLHVDYAMTQHDLAIGSLTQYCKRAARTGYAYAEVSRRFAHSDEPFWSREARRNRSHALALAVLAVSAAAATVAMRSVWPAMGGLAILVALAARTAWKARWKSSSAATLLLYGIHSHFQQLPICWGQLRFALNKRRGEAASLVEYKVQ